MCLHFVDGYGKSYCFVKLARVYNYLWKKKELTSVIIIMCFTSSFLDVRSQRIWNICAQIVKSVEFDVPDNDSHKEMTEGREGSSYCS